MASVPDPRPAREATSQQHEFMLSWLSHACEEHRGKHGVIKGVWLVAIRQPDGWDVEKEKKEAKYEWKWMEVEYKTDQQQKDLRKRFPQHVELPKYIKMLTDPGLIAKLGQVAVLICDFTIGIDKFQFLQLISGYFPFNSFFKHPRLSLVPH